MRHATEADLDRLEDLLLRLRALPQLRERRRGSFSRGSRGFLHFHEDAGRLDADVKLGGAYQRVSVTTETERRRFMEDVEQELATGAGE
jgi:hypothetical protein